MIDDIDRLAKMATRRSNLARRLLVNKSHAEGFDTKIDNLLSGDQTDNLGHISATGYTPACLWYKPWVVVVTVGFVHFHRFIVDFFAFLNGFLK
jgi:hypothetical protein